MKLQSYLMRKIRLLGKRMKRIGSGLKSSHEGLKKECQLGFKTLLKVLMDSLSSDQSRLSLVVPQARVILLSESTILRWKRCLQDSIGLITRTCTISDHQLVSSITRFRLMVVSQASGSCVVKAPARLTIQAQSTLSSHLILLR